MKKIPIILLEDDIALRNNIKDYLEATDRYTVIFEASKLNALIDFETDVEVRFIVLDNFLRDGTSIENVFTLKTKFKGAKVIILTGDTRDELLLRAVENEVSSFLQKPFKLSDLVQTLDILSDSEAYLSPELTAKLMKLISDRKLGMETVISSKLSPKQAKIAILLREGYSYKEIARILGISYHTVNHHIKILYDRLGVTSRTELFSIFKNLINDTTSANR